MLADFDIIVLTSCVLFVAGIVKGAIGFGLPLISISLLTLIHPVESALAIISMPLIATNIKLALTGQNILKTVLLHKVFIIAVIIGTMTGVGMIALVDPDFILVVLGCLVLFFSLLSVVNIAAPLMNAGYRSEVGIGALTGFFGGLTSSYGPLIALYLKSRNLSKDAFVSTLCLIITIGALTFALSMGALNFYAIEGFLLSLLSCVPAFIGLYFGEILRTKINADLFFNIILAMVCLIGVHLILKGLHINL